MWLTKTFGCELNNYNRAIGSKLLIAAVRRVRQPGYKFDYLVVLEGDQGIGKSTAILILFSEQWTTDQISDLSKKDAAIDLAGKWVAELGEIEQLIKADVETVKAFLSRSTDHYRPPFGRTAIDVPRQSVLIGSTNQREYLRDSTGNRRIWPVDCWSVRIADLEWLKANRDQLWAEAAHREAAGAAIWLDDAALTSVAVQAQASRMTEDPWTARVRDFVDCIRTVQVPDILTVACMVPVPQQTKALEMRVGDILKGLGWAKQTGWDAQKKRAIKRWVAPREQ